MANPTSFEEISNMRLDDIEDPKPFPVGTYVWLINGMPESGKSREKQTPFWEFKLKPVQAMDDVDRTLLDEIGGLQSGKEMSLTFWITPDSVSMLRNFLRDVLSIKGGLSVTQAIAESVGQQFKGHVSHKPYQRRDGQMGLRAEIDTTVRAI